MLRIATLAAMVLSLVACDREVILVGERLDTRGEVVETAAVNRSVPFTLPRAVANSEWGGVPQSHVALNQNVRRVWSASIGEGNSRKFRLSADPVVSGGRIFTLDSQSRVTALSTTGATLWTADVTPLADSNDDSSGGGIAASGNRVFVTSGFGTLTALDAISGRVIWQQNFSAASHTAPTVSGGTVYAVTNNGAGWALDAATGRILWQVFGVVTDRGVLGGGAPAIAGPLVVFPFSSGQLIAARADGGSTAWAASVVGDRPGRSISVFGDLTGGPVVAANTVYAGSHAGRAAAFDATTGQSLWRADEGAFGPIWVAGGSMFFVSDENRLIRLDASTGETIWVQSLPLFKTNRIRRRQEIYSHFGPVLAGGRLILVSDDRLLRQYTPETGALVGSTTLPGRAARNPIVAGGTMYVVTENGQLHAFR